MAGSETARGDWRSGIGRGRRSGIGRGARAACALAALVLAAACSDSSIGVLESGPTRQLEVDLSGPQSTLGAWRYYDGVRLLECDLYLEARAVGGSSGTDAEWLDGAVDLFDLRTGEYLGTDYMYATEVAYLFGDADIENGERQLSRPLRYTSYGPFRAYVSLRYASGNDAYEATHRFDCR